MIVHWYPRKESCKGRSPPTDTLNEADKGPSIETRRLRAPFRMRVATSLGLSVQSSKAPPELKTKLAHSEVLHAEGARAHTRVRRMASVGRAAFN